MYGHVCQVLSLGINIIVKIVIKNSDACIEGLKIQKSNM